MISEGQKIAFLTISRDNVKTPKNSKFRVAEMVKRAVVALLESAKTDYSVIRLHGKKYWWQENC